jgi:hypothetical protein
MSSVAAGLMKQLKKVSFSIDLTCFAGKDIGFDANTLSAVAMPSATAVGGFV